MSHARQGLRVYAALLGNLADLVQANGRSDVENIRLCQVGCIGSPRLLCDFLDAAAAFLVHLFKTLLQRLIFRVGDIVFIEQK